MRCSSATLMLIGADQITPAGPPQRGRPGRAMPNRAVTASAGNFAAGRLPRLVGEAESADLIRCGGRGRLQAWTILHLEFVGLVGEGLRRRHLLADLTLAFVIVCGSAGLLLAQQGLNLLVATTRKRRVVIGDPELVAGHRG